MTYREAEKKDISLLIELRLTYLTEDRGNLTPEHRWAISAQLQDYFERNLGSMFFAHLAEQDGRTVGTAFFGGF